MSCFINSYFVFTRQLVQIAILAEKGDGLFDAVKVVPLFLNEKAVGSGWTYKAEMTRLIAGLGFHHQQLAVG